MKIACQKPESGLINSAETANARNTMPPMIVTVKEEKKFKAKFLYGAKTLILKTNQKHLNPISSAKNTSHA